MKKLNSIVASVRNKYASTRGVDFSKYSSARFILEKKNTKSSIESSKGSKFALVVCYAFLISIFGSERIANLLDPKFPF